MSSPDPYSPDYVPDEHASRPNVDGAGAGAGFGADLYALYRAGSQYFPEKAAAYSEITRDLAHTETYVEQAVADTNHELAMWWLSQLHDELHQAMYETTRTLRDIGPALVQVADNYVATDDAARAEYERYLERNRDREVRPETPYVPPPVAPN